MLLPCRLKTRISTASSATSMRPSRSEYPTPGWVSFQSATLGQFCIGTNKLLSLERLLDVAVEQAFRLGRIVCLRIPVALPLSRIDADEFDDFRFLAQPRHGAGAWRA